MRPNEARGSFRGPGHTLTMAVNVAMAAVITANIRNALSVTSCALRSVIDAIQLLPRPP